MARWGEVARRYTGDPIIAGYNPICEPVTKDVALLNELYLATIRAIRKTDADHIIMRRKLSGQGKKLIYLTG